MLTDIRHRPSKTVRGFNLRLLIQPETLHVQPRLLTGALCLLLLPPGWQSVEEAEVHLRLLVHGHDVFEAAASPLKGAVAVVDPFRAVYFLLSLLMGARRGGASVL